jgi:hypothetical protein
VKKLLLIVVLSLLLSACLSPQSNSSKPVVNNTIREINLMPMGSNKYTLLIRGNILSTQAMLRQQFNQEVNGVCGNNFEILEIITRETTHLGHTKPMAEGSFVCK